MSKERQETVTDVVAAMRNESHAGDECFLEWVSSKMRSYADRIEAAVLAHYHKAGASNMIGETFSTQETGVIEIWEV